MLCLPGLDIHQHQQCYLMDTFIKHRPFVLYWSCKDLRTCYIQTSRTEFNGYILAYTFWVCWVTLLQYTVRSLFVLTCTCTSRSIKTTARRMLFRQILSAVTYLGAAWLWRPCRLESHTYWYLMNRPNTIDLESVVVLAECAAVWGGGDMRESRLDHCEWHWIGRNISR